MKMKAVVFAALVSFSACRSNGSGLRSKVDIVIVAPHPDDEVLMAGGVLAQAIQNGRTAAVLVVTNGDLTCLRDGARRMGETVEAMAALGVGESDLHFLGYPDGYLNGLTEVPVSVERLLPSGECAKVDSTWAIRGAGQVDAHRQRTGQPAPFIESVLVGDLAALFEVLAPKDVYLPHGADAHPDHAATYRLVKQSLMAVSRKPEVLHRSLVHSKDPCWPGPCTLPRHLRRFSGPALQALYGEMTERVQVNAESKKALILTYRSQTAAPVELDWLLSFARSEEVFAPERLVEGLPVVSH